MYDVSGLGPSRKEEGRGMILKTSYFVLAKGDTSKFKIRTLYFVLRTRQRRYFKIL